jgi:hypothetical protein
MGAFGKIIRKSFAYFLFFLTFVFTMPVVTGEEGWPIALFMGAGAALLGGLLIRGLRREAKKEQRGAEIERQLAVLRLADSGDGSLTATEVATRLGWPIETALAALRSLDDGIRVTSSVTDEGIILFEFLELIHDPSGRKKPPAAVATVESSIPPPQVATPLQKRAR